MILAVIMDIKSLKFINTTETYNSTWRSSPTLQNSGDLPLWTYNHSEVMLINNATKYDQRYNILPFEAIRSIRSLKINCKKVNNNKWHKIMQTGVNLCNLVQITRLPALKDQWLKMPHSTFNPLDIRLRSKWTHFWQQSGFYSCHWNLAYK